MVSTVFTLGEGVRIACDASVERTDTVTRWVGAVGFRVSAAPAARAPVVESRDDGGDSLRFDGATRVLREVYLTRPRALAMDSERLEALRSAPEVEGTMVLCEGASGFALPPTERALYDISLDLYAAVVGTWIDEAPIGVLVAVPASEHLAFLFSEGRYVGWRVRAPMDVVCPMEYPPERPVEVAGEEHRGRLAALLYDWMTIDGQSVVRPDLVDDSDEVAHMVGVRARARALAECAPASAHDVTAAVAREVAAQVHWAWGFFRVGEE